MGCLVLQVSSTFMTNCSTPKFQMDQRFDIKSKGVEWCGVVECYRFEGKPVRCLEVQSSGSIPVIDCRHNQSHVHDGSV